MRSRVWPRGTVAWRRVRQCATRRRHATNRQAPIYLGRGRRGTPRPAIRTTAADSKPRAEAASSGGRELALVEQGMQDLGRRRGGQHLVDVPLAGAFGG